MYYPLTVLIRKEIKFTARQPIYWVSNILSSAFIVWMSVKAGSPSEINLINEGTHTTAHLSNLLLNAYMLLLPFSSFIFMSLYIFGQLFTAEKLLGQLEALLTTPLRTEQLWLGKCLSMLFMVYPFVFVTLIFVIGLGGQQVGGHFLLPPSPVLFTAFIVSPLLAFWVVSSLGFLSLLAKRVNTVQSLVFLTGFGSAYGGAFVIRALISNLQPGDNIIGWPIAISALIIVFILCIALWLLHSRLSKDRIVSSLN